MSQQLGFEQDSSIVLLDESSAVSISASVPSTLFFIEQQCYLNHVFLLQLLISFIIVSWQYAGVEGCHIRFLLFANPSHKLASLPKQKMENRSINFCSGAAFFFSAIATKQCNNTHAHLMIFIKITCLMRSLHLISPNCGVFVLMLMSQTLCMCWDDKQIQGLFCFRVLFNW